MNTIVTHADCPDGYASALILKDAFPPAEVIFMQHGSKEHREFTGRNDVLFCDFVPHESTIESWLKTNVRVLDHHVTSRHVVEALHGVYKEDRCGAQLAFDVWKDNVHLAPTNASRRTIDGYDYHTPVVKHFADRAAVRDLWKTSDEDWNSACAQASTLMLYGWRRLSQIKECLWAYNDFTDVGEMLLEHRAEEVKTAVKNAVRMTLADRRVVLFQNKMLSSDVAEHLGKEADVVVGFSFVGDEIEYSTRSHTGFDCARLAKALGGGGHQAAAGFRRPYGDPREVFLQAFREVRSW